MADVSNVDPAALPDLEHVADLVASRTKAAFVDLGTFTADTKPNADQVTRLAERSARQVYAQLGPYAKLPTDDLKAAAVDLVALRTSLWVELSFFAEQAEAGPYKELLAAFTSDLAALTSAVEESKATGDDPTAGDGMAAAFSFPAAPAPYGYPGDVAGRYPGAETPWG